MSERINGVFHSDDGDDYPARLLYKDGGIATVAVTFPVGHPNFPDGATDVVHFPRKKLSTFFTADGAKPTKRSEVYRAALKKARQQTDAT